jgi:hypothetical protein
MQEQRATRKKADRTERPLRPLVGSGQRCDQQLDRALDGEVRVEANVRWGMRSRLAPKRLPTMPARRTSKPRHEYTSLTKNERKATF